MSLGNATVPTILQPFLPTTKLPLNFGILFRENPPLYVWLIFAEAFRQ